MTAGRSALRPRRLAAFALAAAALAAAAAFAAGDAGRALPLYDGVRDPVFAALIGYVYADSQGAVTGDDLARTVSASGRKTRLPFKRVDRIERKRAERPEVHEITCDFVRDVKERIPYSILGYHPGSVRATQRTVWREWALGTMMVSHVEEKRPVTIRLEDVRLWALTGGEFEIDVDGLIDRLLGGRIDDTRVTGLVVFRDEGKLHGIAFGYNRDGAGQSGVLSFPDDAIRFPSPERMKTVARTMRSRVEAILGAEKQGREQGFIR